MQLEWLSRSDALRVLHAVVSARNARQVDQAVGGAAGYPPLRHIIGQGGSASVDEFPCLSE
jgi:hypothetical protein